MAAAAVKASPPQQHSFRSCSICSFKSYILSSSDGGGGSENDSGYRKNQNHSSSSTAGLLDASFVNIYSPIIDTTTNNNSSDRSSSDIDSILNDALSHTSDHGRAAAPLRGGTFQDSSMKMDAYAEAAIELIMDGQNNVVEEGREKKYFCNVCIERIGHAIDSYSEHILDESMVYDEAASSEEERSSSIRKMLSRVVNLNNNAAAADKDVNNTIVSNDGEEDSAIQWAIDSFQLELEALANACYDQEEELRILQTLMHNQIIRSKSISNEEDRVMDALNALEIGAHNFREESNLVTKQCSDVMSELDALSRVNLTSLSFKIAVDWSGDDDNDGGGGTTTATQQKVGRYPTINNLRLAYRVNQKAGLGRKEICAAWNQAAQLITFTCGLNPSFSFSNVRIIPLSYPCAKIVATFPEGQSVHNLGWDDTLDEEDDVSSHVPSLSITLFLALLSELSDHIISILANEQHDGATTLSSPPFPMTQCSIDSVDVTCLGDTDTASWSSAVFCIAVNLRWLAQLKLPISMLQGNR